MIRWLLITILFSTTASAEEILPRWPGEVAASYVQTTGNTRTTTVGASANGWYQTSRYKIGLASEYIWSRNNQVTAARRIGSTLRAEQVFKPESRLSAYSQVSYAHNRFAGYQSRVVCDAGGLYKFVKSSQSTVAVSVGVAQTFTHPISGAIPKEGRNFLGGRTVLSHTYKNTRTETLQETSYLHDFSRANNWRVDNNSTLSASVARMLAIKLSYQLSYTNSPEPGRRHTDTMFLTSLVAKWPAKRD